MHVNEARFSIYWIVILISLYNGKKFADIYKDGKMGYHKDTKCLFCPEDYISRFNIKPKKCTSICFTPAAVRIHGKVFPRKSNTNKEFVERIDAVSALNT